MSDDPGPDTERPPAPYSDATPTMQSVYDELVYLRADVSLLVNHARSLARIPGIVDKLREDFDTHRIDVARRLEILERDMASLKRAHDES